MAKRRLSEGLREAIVKNMVSKVFDEKIEAAKKEVGKSCAKILNDRGILNEHNILEVYRPYLSITDTAWVRYATRSGYAESAPFKMPIAFARNHQKSMDISNTETPVQGLKEFLALTDASGDLWADLTTICKAYKYVEDLVAAVPELEQAVPPQEGVSGALVPIEQINSLRKRINNS